MNDAYLLRAQEQIKDPKVLTVMIAKRSRELANGKRPMIKCDDEDFLDVALLEVAEGLLSFELNEDDKILKL